MNSYQFPGKLFLMGEYMITSPKQEAIIAAVNRFINIEIKKAESFLFRSDYGTLTDENLDNPIKELKIASEAIKIAYEYLDYLNVDAQNLHIDVKSDLLIDGKKIGLGSSGVIMLALISSILLEHDVKVSNLKKFKLAILCQERLGLLGSGGDLAAASYTGLVYYRSYDFDWFSVQDKSFDLLEIKWPGLIIKQIALDSKQELLVAWTKTENDTNEYLKVFNHKKLEDGKTYEKFTKKASSYVKMFLEGNVFEAIESYRLLMLELQKWTALNIETKDLEKAIEIANKNGAAAKVSGSGGGDCMIALIENANKDKIYKEWERNCVHPLKLEVWYDAI